MAVKISKDAKGVSPAKGKQVAKGKQPSGDKGTAENLAQKPVGSAKGIETMFRNVYRADLDMIALAATKANIMISLNGFIVSALMISGAFIFASSPAFLLPAGIFLFTAAASIFFALLAASPESTELFGALWRWIKAVFKREASLGDFRERVWARRSFIDGTSNILVFEDRVKLSKDEYWERMRGLMTDHEDIYQHMSDHLYWLGLNASKKFKLLSFSYSIFRWGLVVSVAAFLSVKSIQQMIPVYGSETAVHLRSVGISQLTDVYEPSAAQQLPDGRVLVVEDEATRAFSLMKFAPDGTLSRDAAMDIRLVRSFRRKLSDLEGLTMDGQGYVYAITSHSRTKSKKRLPDREQLLRFKIRGNNAVDISSYTTLTDALKGASELQNAIKAKTGKTADFGAINIEGLDFDRNKQHLLLGFREPTVDGKSIIVAIKNPAGMFEHNEAPQFGDVTLLDLQGGGIRSLNYDPVLGAFLLANEVVGRNGKNFSQLWSWSGDPEAAPKPVGLPDILNLKNVEALDSITVNGEPRLLIMSDEGNIKKGQPGKYMLLDYKQLMQ